MKDTEARKAISELSDRVDNALTAKKRYCPICKRKTLTTVDHLRPFFPDEYTCEICGTEYQINQEEKITILNPKRPHRRK